MQTLSWKCYLLGSLFFTSSAFADFCNRTPIQIHDQFLKEESRMGFRNQGGLFKGGVCWWHSRLQRSAVYLSTFAPDEPKPSESAAQEIIQQLVHFKQVVSIPGYSNFKDFSHDYQEVVQKELNAWQIRDGFIYQQWTRGVSGQSSMKPEKLKKHLDKIYSKFLVSDPAFWVMAQMKGITSHALLFIDMEKTSDGYKILYVDSNFPKASTVATYHYGDRSITKYQMVPYAGFHQDLVHIHKAINQHCGFVQKDEIEIDPLDDLDLE